MWFFDEKVKMVAKFVFPFMEDEIVSVDGGYDITPNRMMRGDGVPSKIELRAQTIGCSIDAYALLISQDQLPYRDGVFDNRPNSDYGCNEGISKQTNFGKIFSGDSTRCSSAQLFCNGSLIESYTAVPKSNGNKNYCTISLQMKDGKTCTDLSFGSDLRYFKDRSGNKITSATSTYDSTITSISAICNGNKILYNHPNSTMNFNQSDSNNPRLEFAPIGSPEFDCQYHDGENYLSFLCNDAGTGVNAVQYKCGL